MRCVHVVPFQSQVSLSTAVADWPPKSTVCCRMASQAMAWRARALGDVAGLRRNQVVPFHSQVSFSRPAAFSPPKSTTTPLAESKVME